MEVLLCYPRRFTEEMFFELCERSGFEVLADDPLGNSLRASRAHFAAARPVPEQPRTEQREGRREKWCVRICTVITIYTQ